jgi:hypothetical protein
MYIIYYFARLVKWFEIIISDIPIIRRFAQKFDKLRAESEKRYARTDLTETEKDLTEIQIRNPRAGNLTYDKKIEPDFTSAHNLNNPLGSVYATTSSFVPPQEIGT